MLNKSPSKGREREKVVEKRDVWRKGGEGEYKCEAQIRNT
jgi:hypothetical protein